MISQACPGSIPATYPSPPFMWSSLLMCRRPSKVFIAPSSAISTALPYEWFAGKRFAPALPLEMLDRKGVEVVIIGESDNLVGIPSFLTLPHALHLTLLIEFRLPSLANWARILRERPSTHRTSPTKTSSRSCTSPSRRTPSRRFATALGLDSSVHYKRLPWMSVRA